MVNQKIKKPLKYLFFLIVILGIFTFMRTCYSSPGFEHEPVSEAHSSVALPFESGEKINYTIKSLGLSVGKASLSFHGFQQLNGREVFLIRFSASAVNFLDEEEIYADAESFYPVMVKRNLNIWGKKEKIIEEYNSKEGKIKITKYIGDKVIDESIEKEGLIDNIYCFIYRCRRLDHFEIGESFFMILPTKDVDIQLVKETKLKTAGQVYDAYYMRSVPPKYKVWFDTGKKKIPLRINGSVGLNNTTMTMVDYEEKTN